MHALLCLQAVHNPALDHSTDEDGCSKELLQLNLVADKEWQHLFAVLTISNQPKQCNEPHQQQPAQSQQSSQLHGKGSHLNSQSAGNNIAVSSHVQVAPSTPSRTDLCSHTAAAGVEQPTPTRRSFLATEFSRVHSRQQACMQMH
jgi:hypothetical protein